MAQKLSLPPFSFLSQTPIYSVGGNIVPGLMVPAVTAHSSDIPYVVPLAGERRIDLISHLHYGTTELWWVLLQVNGLIDPLAGVAANSTIRVPTRERLAALGLLNT
jgi:hypothetical protein